MLQLKNIVKDYYVGDSVVNALRGIDLEFRKSEFVAILGHSGCGKTTLLNIVGGLDHYTEGDLIIDGRSTKEFNDTDWDSYRNHSIGFVFQSYNLIPHQSVLSNVELALTLSGVSKSERKRRAEEALKKVGLEEQIYKKPNQLSGGQMQRVAIARALVNNPEILLADEATGALDSETSVQIMDLLKEISKDRLVIMVTHNPDLAEQYATRIIKLLDGKVTGDSDPYTSGDGAKQTEALSKKEQKRQKKLKKKRSMSLFTALSLSLNNLMTKKARTLLTSFAGSIGIIGIALILSVSTGVQNYINRVQEDTLSSYPITIQAETVDMSGLITSFMNAGNSEEVLNRELDKVYSSSVLKELMNSLNSLESEKNNLVLFKEFIDSSEEMKLHSSAIKYSYNFDTNIFTKDTDGKVVKSDAMELISTMMEKVYGSSMSSMMSNPYASSMTGNSYNVWEEMLPGSDDGLINELLYEQYDVIYGNWPQNYNEIVLIVNNRNEISDIVLYALGLKTADALGKDFEAVMDQDIVSIDNTESWSYEDICSREFKLILSADFYSKGANGAYTDLTNSEAGMNFLYDSDKATTLKIVGILRPNDEAVANMMTGSIAYTAALTEYVIDKTAENELLKAQLADPTTDVISGFKFKTDSDEELSSEEKAIAIKEYYTSLSNREKAEIYKSIISTPTEEYLESSAASMLIQYTREQLVAMMISSYSEQMGVSDTESIEQYINSMDDETLYSYVTEMLKAMISEQFSAGALQQLSDMTEDQLAYAFDIAEYTEEEYAVQYDRYMPKNISDSTYEENLKLLGNVDKSNPSIINIYASTFSDKDIIGDIISKYNDTAEEEDEINYTDYVALMMSSISTVIDAISYVLIAFVAISLVVSSIMIGIITYISVLERTKEIGILRAIGASKRDVSRVFNAETLIVGFVAGALGIIITLLLLIPINLILTTLTGIAILKATLPTEGIIVLVTISMVLTFIAGLLPSRIAAKKDPVIALRSE
ncbi:MAG: ABC transporter ATP-binding protein/permease [Ruminococcaceae bacterium]|nr:ABC transporter ATP-binding protein/permease [Oscillospiraceae bacterium]